VKFIQRWLSFTVGDSVPTFWVKLGANDLNCVDMPLNPTHSLTHSRILDHFPQLLTKDVARLQFKRRQSGQVKCRRRIRPIS